MFKDFINFVFVVDIGDVVDDDEQDLEFVNKLDILQKMKWFIVML